MAAKFKGHAKKRITPIRLHVVLQKKICLTIIVEPPTFMRGDDNYPQQYVRR